MKAAPGPQHFFLAGDGKSGRDHGLKHGLEAVAEIRIDERASSQHEKPEQRNEVNVKTKYLGHGMGENSGEFGQPKTGSVQFEVQTEEGFFFESFVENPRPILR